MIFTLATVSGGSINPPRSFGPAVLSRILLKGQYLRWIYWVDPIIDGASGALWYKFMYNEKGKIHYAPGNRFSDTISSGGIGASLIIYS
jgi:hypothetical protein